MEKPPADALKEIEEVLIKPMADSLLDLLTKPNPNWMPNRRRQPAMESFRMSQRERDEFLVKERAKQRKGVGNG